MANTTNYNWETPDDTDLVKDGAAAIRTLGSSIDTTTKNLNPQTTTGALAYRSATANVNTALPIGTAGQILAVSGGVPAWINNDQGDITEVQAGTGISVASGTGPIPTVSINTAVTADLTTAQTLTNKTIALGSNTVSGTTAQFNTALTDGDFATIAGSETLTNKTLTSPVLTTPTISTIDAKGDLLVGTADNTIGRLAVGATNGMVLTVDSAEATGLKYATPAGSSGPTFQAQRASDQSISAGTWVKVQLATENWDSDSCYDPTTNYRFTPNKAGYYQVNMNIRFGVDSGGGQITAANIYKNGASDLIYGWCLNTNGTSTSMIDGSGQIYFNGSTDYIELYAFNNGGTTRNVNGLTFMDAVWIRS